MNNTDLCNVSEMSNSDLCNVSEINSTIIKCIEKYNFMSCDFLNYNNKILNDICRIIKAPADSFHRNRVYQKCKKHFNVSLCNPSDDTNHID